MAENNIYGFHVAHVLKDVHICKLASHGVLREEGLL